MNRVGQDQPISNCGLRPNSIITVVSSPLRSLGSGHRSAGSSVTATDTSHDGAEGRDEGLSEVMDGAKEAQSTQRVLKSTFRKQRVAAGATQCRRRSPLEESSDQRARKANCAPEFGCCRSSSQDIQLGEIELRSHSYGTHTFGRPSLQHRHRPPLTPKAVDTPLANATNQSSIVAIIEPRRQRQ